MVGFYVYSILPATAALCAQVVTAEMDRARREGNAPKMTVGKTIKEGYDALRGGVLFLP